MKNKVKEKRYKLDNAATIYPSVMTKTWSAMFRLSANLKENIDQDILYAAINDTLNRLPSFKSKLKKGFFWFYFTENTKDIVICKETNKPLLKYSFKKNNDYINTFDISYVKGDTSGYISPSLISEKITSMTGVLRILLT